MKRNGFLNRSIQNTVFLIFTFFILTISSCAKKEEIPLVEKKREKKETKITVLKKEKTKYKYTGDLYRDPFVSLAGKKVMSSLLDNTTEAEPPSIGTLELKGIMVDKNVQIALLSSPSGSYILKNGKLYDSRNRIVRSIKGLIQEKGVKIITDDNFERFIKLKEIQ